MTLSGFFISFFESYLVFTINGYTGGPIELPIAAARRSELVQKFSVLIEYLHSIVTSIGDDDTILFIARYTPRSTQLTVFASFAAERENRMSADGRVIASFSDQQRKWTAVYGFRSNENVHLKNEEQYKNVTLTYI